MDELIYGSVAAKHWFPDFREPKDLDIITIQKQPNTDKIEYHWTPAFSYILQHNKDPKYVDPDFLYTIKVSHAAWDIRFDKTLMDIAFLREKGCKLDKQLFDRLYLDWEKLHGKKNVYFTNSNDTFFTKTIDRKYDHDTLHKLLAFYDEPLHNRIRPNPYSPKTSKALFNKLSYDDQLKCALEEIYVIATERYLLKGEKSLQHCKLKAMKALVTSMTKGWFCIFLIENYKNLVYHKNDELKTKLKKEKII